MIRKWQTELMQHSNLAPTYQRSINTKLSALFNYAVKYYNLPAKPCTQGGNHRQQPFTAPFLLDA